MVAANWRDLAAAALAETAPQAGDARSDLPPDLVAGFARLQQMQPPKLRDARAWPEVVRDAGWLIGSGWAARAIALGWDPLALFGVGARSSLAFEGLAVWLRGRRVVLLDHASAVAADGNWRAIYRRPGPLDPGLAVPLWEFGCDGR